jgi:hypothetical protein
MPKVDPVTKEEWERYYDPMHNAFQNLFRWHMVNAPTPEEIQARTVMDMAITVVNLFVVNAPGITPKVLRTECLTFIENMRRAIEADDLTQYCLSAGKVKAEPTKMDSDPE